MSRRTGCMLRASTYVPPPDQLIFTTGQVAKLCSVAPRTVGLWVDMGKLRGYRIPGAGAANATSEKHRGEDRRIRRIDLIEFLSRHGMPLGALQPVGLLTYGLQPGESLPGETRVSDAFAFGAAVAAGPVAAAVVGDADGVTLALTACRTILAAQSWVRVALVLSEDAVVDHDDLPPGRTYRRPTDWQAVLAFVSGLDSGRAV